MPNQAQENKSTFKRCTMCKHHWSTQEDFLADPDLRLIGYQANFGHLSLGYFLFTHTCGTTIAVTVKSFENLHEGEIFTTRATGNAACPSYCVRQGSLEPCPVPCECAFVRDIIQIIKTWPRAN
ncbi:MAG: hypothetical protein ISS35_05030 [Kiritimatiellae bacterium]|nr:hypothetical protein [Kiritimatiellia bacterium]